MFVEKDVDEEAQAFYGKKKFPIVVGVIILERRFILDYPSVWITGNKKANVWPSFLPIVQAVSVALATLETGILQLVDLPRYLPTGYTALFSPVIHQK